jgi:hypothetical protein
MSMIATRAAQAGLAARIWEVLHEESGPEAADAILAEAIRRDAEAAGASFARLAPDKPSLQHFATVLTRWQEDNALVVKDVVLTESCLSFAVTDCLYARAYADMGLPPELGFILSCSRDEPFAQGYSPCLSMTRSQTIMQGAPACMFTFQWNTHPLDQII